MTRELNNCSRESNVFMAASIKTCCRRSFVG